MDDPSLPSLGQPGLLTPFEETSIPNHYKEYYRAKRNNLFATIQGFPYLWETYMRLDAIWERGIHDLNIPGRLNELLPLELYLVAHAKVRVSVELAMSCCLGEARSILRDAVECTAHAHRMRFAPQLQVVWVSKEEDEKAFKAAFQHNKKGGLLQGLEELHRAWGILSEKGACSRAWKSYIAHGASSLRRDRTQRLLPWQAGQTTVHDPTEVWSFCCTTPVANPKQSFLLSSRCS
jgi:hypothetical protein